MSVNAAPHSAIRFPLNLPQRIEWQHRLNAMAVLHHLGACLDLSDAAITRLTLGQCTEAHLGGLGTSAVNGAVMAGMIDCAISTTGILHFKGKTCGTVSLSIQLMKPVRNRAVTVESYAVRRTAHVVFAEARVLDARGRSSVAATGIVSLAPGSDSNPAGENAEGRGNWFSPIGSGESDEALLHSLETRS